MLDVHAPEHPIGNVREFLIHLFTITCGLLIALGLENTAEAMHHRRERREAEANIRQELERNRNTIKQGASVVLGERSQLLHNFDVLQSAAQGQKIPHGSMTFNYTDATLDDAAWRTANDTGVLAFMEYGEVERFADAYKEQTLLEATEEKALEDYLQITPTLGQKDLTALEAKDALPEVRHAIAHVSGVMAVGRGTLDAYNKALQ